MAAKSTHASQNDLAKRVSQLEKQLQRIQSDSAPTTGVPKAESFCSVPELPPREMGPNVSAERARLLVYNGKKWVNETLLHYYFFESASWGAGDDQKDIVREGFEVWDDVGIGIRFEEVTSIDDAEIRIGFQRGDGYWSYLGRDILSIGQHERTMNFGSDLTLDSRGVDVPVHEIGHTLGFPHEHQNPNSGIVWNEQAVIDYFSGPPNNWDRDGIDSNILRKLPSHLVTGSEWDPDSIMHYAFGPGLIEQPERYQGGLHPERGLSETDIEEVRTFYPPVPTNPVYPELKPYELQRLALSSGQQRDFSITPASTREYTIQTFGSTDSVMVLFEDIDGEHQYVAGDDDSGWDRNARIQLRLYKGRKYVIRLRLYYQWASGDLALMLW